MAGTGQESRSSATLSWKGQTLQQERSQALPTRLAPSTSNNQTQLHTKTKDKVKQDLLIDLVKQWSSLDTPNPAIGGSRDRPGDPGQHTPDPLEETTQPEIVKAIRAQTAVIEKPPRKAPIGVIDPHEGTKVGPESLPGTSNHLGPILEIFEDVDDSVSFQYLSDKPKTIPIKFRPSVGDVIIAAKPKKSNPEIEPEIDINADPNTATRSNETKSQEFYPSNDPVHLNGLVALYKDSFYYIDDGEYRKNVSDVYKFEQGDIVARLGHFNENWHWSHAPRFDFYLYYPKRVEGQCCTDPSEVGPWFLINKEEKSQTGGHEPDDPPKPFPTIVPSDLLPFSTLSYPFEFRDGDVLLHLTNDKTLFKPWNVGLNVMVENSKNRGEPAKILQPLDKILRYGISVQHDINTGRETTTIYVELYQFYGGSEWIFLGKDEGLYNHVASLPAMIRFNVNTPQPGDIMINRRSCREWDATEQTGGLVEIYKDESFFSLLDQPREKLKTHIWGVGSDTTVVRFGTFVNKEWNWMPKPSVDIFILNARGISLRRHCRIPWDDEWRPKANYNFALYNPKIIPQVPPQLKPKTGDVVIRYCAGNLVWDSKGLEQIREPSVKIEFFNAMHLAGNMLQNGNWLLRVGCERSDKNKYWTHITAELYRFVVDPNNHRNKHWEFQGRDKYVFGALEWPQNHGFFSGKEPEEPYADPDKDLEIDDFSVAKLKGDPSRAVRQFIDSLGFQIMAYPLKDPWWYKITDVPVRTLDKE